TISQTSGASSSLAPETATRSSCSIVAPPSPITTVPASIALFKRIRGDWHSLQGRERVCSSWPEEEGAAHDRGPEQARRRHPEDAQAGCLRRRAGSLLALRAQGHGPCERLVPEVRRGEPGDLHLRRHERWRARREEALHARPGEGPVAQPHALARALVRRR